MEKALVIYGASNTDNQRENSLTGILLDNLPNAHVWHYASYNKKVPFIIMCSVCRNKIDFDLPLDYNPRQSLTAIALAYRDMHRPWCVNYCHIKRLTNGV